MSESGPIWRVTEPAPPYPDGRFDGGRELWMADPIKIGVDHPNYTPPLDPQQPTPEQIADAARDALDNIETVLMHWTFHFISDMSKLRALRDMLTPPAPKWTAKDDDE